MELLQFSRRRKTGETVDNDDYRNAWFHCIEMACAMLLTEMEEGERIEVIKQAWKEMRDGTDTQE